MIIIAFSKKTSKIIPKLLCHKFRHCAPVVVKSDGSMVMYQFVKYGHIVPITITMRDIKILGIHNWTFVYKPGNWLHNHPDNRSITCVQMTCRMIGMNGFTTLTPDMLYKKLKQ